MSSFLRCTSGFLARGPLLIVMTAFLVVSTNALAQVDPTHGFGISKSCTGVPRTCDTNADCGSNANECAENVCDLTISDAVNCTYKATYTDDFGDTLTITGAFDTVHALPSDVRVPAAGNAVVYQTSGNTTCTPGGSLPCTIGPDLGLGAGIVVFRTNTYLPDANDPSPLNDTAQLNWSDDCTGTDPPIALGGNCLFDQPPQTIQGATNLQTGCKVQNKPSSTACTDTGEECWDAGCDGAGACVQQHVPTSPSTACTDTGNECADAGCDGAGNCDQLHTPKSPSTACTDTGEECWDAGCDGAGACVQQHVPTSPSTACTDTGNECADAGCDGAGNCDQLHTPKAPSTACTDTGNECADAGCDGAGTCDQLHTPKSPSTACTDTGEECWDAGCDGAGACVQQHVPTSPSTACTDTGNECADAGCDGAGNCDQLHTPKSPSTACTDTGEECWDAGCDGAGACVQQHVPTSPSTACTDTGNECADAGCDGAGNCDQLHAPKSPSTPCGDTGEACFDAGCDGAGQCDQFHVPLVCGEEICRTPGFWGARGGTEKAPKSQNITQTVIDSVPGGLDVCGTFITNTDLLDSQSAIEAICVSVKGDIQRQLVRQLTAAALNCALANCSTEHQTLIADCNVVCDTGVGDMQACIGELDRFNNGGYGEGFCDIGGEACSDNEPCVGVGDFCQPVESCHDRDLCPDFDDDGIINGSDFCFEPPGPASSPQKCNAARKNDVYVP